MNIVVAGVAALAVFLIWWAIASDWVRYRGWSRTDEWPGLASFALDAPTRPIYPEATPLRNRLARRRPDPDEDKGTGEPAP